MPPARHQYETYVRATPAQVWQAITDPAFTRQYFHGTAFDRPLVAQESYTTSRADGSPAVEGTVAVLDPPHHLVLTWHPLYDTALAAEPPGRVEWHVEAAGEGLTRVRVVHSDLAQSPLTWASVEHGWVWILDSMKTLLETGSPLPDVESEGPDATDAVGEWHRMQAVEANNSVWELIEKPDLPGPQLANIGAYLFPRSVFDLTLTESPRGEYEITEAVSLLAARGRFEVVEASYWLPIGNVPQWEAAQTADLAPAGG